MFGFGMVRCKKRWCRRQFTRSYRGFINSETLGWYHERLGVSWCREHNPMRGNTMPVSRKRRGANKHRLNPRRPLLDRFAGAMARDDIKIPHQALGGYTGEEFGERLKELFAAEEMVADYIEHSLFGSVDPVEPQGITPMVGALVDAKNLCLLCARGNHDLLVGNPECECCPNHYKSIHDL